MIDLGLGLFNKSNPQVPTSGDIANQVNPSIQNIMSNPNIGSLGAQDIATAQQHLIDQGYDLGAGGADSIWGPKSKQAFQKYTANQSGGFKHPGQVTPMDRFQQSPAGQGVDAIGNVVNPIVGGARDMIGGAGNLIASGAQGIWDMASGMFGGEQPQTPTIDVSNTVAGTELNDPNIPVSSQDAITNAENILNKYQGGAPTDNTQVAPGKKKPGLKWNAPNYTFRGF
jgi:hypothetical protein